MVKLRSFTEGLLVAVNPGGPEGVAGASHDFVGHLLFLLVFFRTEVTTSSWMPPRPPRRVWAGGTRAQGSGVLAVNIGIDLGWGCFELLFIA